MNNPASQMTQNPADAGTYTYAPQKQLPPSAQTIIINPPQSLPQIQGDYASPTEYRPSTDQFIGTAVVPQLVNARATIRQFSQYSPSMVTSSSIPGYVSQNGVASSAPYSPRDGLEAGSR